MSFFCRGANAMSSIITLTTDFGRDSAYVAAMKGVILCINPAAAIVDISHGISPQNVAEGGFVLGEAARGGFLPIQFMSQSSTQASALSGELFTHASANSNTFAPTMDCLSHVCRRETPTSVFEVTNRSLFMTQVSNTFHGRDIMAPAAAHLSLGLPVEQLGARLDRLTLFECPPAKRHDRAVVGKILFADSFGNLVTNIGCEDLPCDVAAASMIVETEKQQLVGVKRTYGESDHAMPVALFGSSGWLELAVVNGSAAAQLGLPIGSTVSVRW